MSEGHLNVSAEGAANWWRLLEKVAVIVIVDLLYILQFKLSLAEFSGDLRQVFFKRKVLLSWHFNEV